MKKLKIFLCMVMTVTLLGHTTTTVWAAVNHVDGCGNTTSTYNQCAGYVSTAVWDVCRHYNAETKEYVQCTRTAELHFHDVLCANASCRALYETNKVLPCILRHNPCGKAETQVCKTMN